MQEYAQKNKFFIVSQVFYPDETATAAILTDIARQIAAEPGIEVEAWCAQPSYSTRERQKSRVVYDNISIAYMPGTNYPKGHLAGRLLNYLTFSASLLFRLLLSGDTAPIVTVTNPPYLGMLIYVVSRIKKRPYVYIIHDVQPDGLVRLGMLKAHNPLAVIWRRCNRRVLKHAARIIIIGRDMAQWVRETHAAALAKTVFIPNCHDEALFRPVPFSENTFVRKHRLEHCFIVQYSGNMGLWNDMALLGRAAQRLEQRGVTFCFIGDGMRKAELLAAWNGTPPGNAKLFPFQPKSSLSMSLSACHIALISLRAGLEGIAVPSKLYGILASGVPIVAQVPSASETALVVQEDRCGIVVAPGDLDGLITAISYLQAHPGERIEMGRNARRAFEEKYTSRAVAAAYVEMIKEIYKNAE